MRRAEVLIVGGGPAGAACAWRLTQNNVDCLILDRQPFPRAKPCAGWLTPEVFQDLGLDPSDYPHGLTSFRSFRVSFRGLKFKLPTRQYAIRRYEFDDWMLRRAKAPVEVHAVQTISQDQGAYVIDGEFSGKYLVGAGGTRCPVYRTFFQSAARVPESMIVAMEEEFRYGYSDGECRLWFLEDHLPGYAWYVPKTGGYVNVGIGGKAEELKAKGDTLKSHWNRLLDNLGRLQLIRDHTFQPSGHSYYLRQPPRELRRDNAFLVGDAAGLATLDMGEGIRPAIMSGLLAAEAILRGSDYTVASIPRYSLLSLIGLARRGATSGKSS